MGAASEEEIRINFNLTDTYGKDNQVNSEFHSIQGAKIPGKRPIEVFMCSVVKQIGYAEGKFQLIQGFNWLSKFL